MKTERRIAYAPHVAVLSRDLAALRGPCLGCTGCKGLCATLIDALVIPDLVLAPARA